MSYIWPRPRWLGFIIKRRFAVNVVFSFNLEKLWARKELARSKARYISLEMLSSLRSDNIVTDSLNYNLPNLLSTAVFSTLFWHNFFLFLKPKQWKHAPRVKMLYRSTHTHKNMKIRFFQNTDFEKKNSKCLPLQNDPRWAYLRMEEIP